MNTKLTHMDDWLDKQAHETASMWSGAIEKYYGQSLSVWNNPEIHVQTLTNEWNALEAIKSIPEELFQGKNKVLDLGCGTGWLSAHLSKQPGTEQIIAVDSDLTMLSRMLPEVVKLMDGNLEKIKPTLGFFTPINKPDNFFDLVISSSAFHHAPNLFDLFREAHRVLKPNGILLVVNETPITNLQCTVRAIKEAIKMVARIMKRSSVELRPMISENGFTYDPFLGDIERGYFQWDTAIIQAGFTYKVIDSCLATYKSDPNGISLKHFICTANK